MATFTARKTTDGSSLGAAVDVTIPAFSHQQLPVFSLINSVATAAQKQDDFYISYTLSEGSDTRSREARFSCMPP